jgi:hypothetical protein
VDGINRMALVFFFSILVYYNVACRGMEEKCSNTGFWWKNWEERDHLEEQGIVGEYLKVTVSCGIDSHSFGAILVGTVISLGCKNCKVLDQFNNY